MTARKIKILIGKPGLDGHDRGAKVIALALRDAGMEVLYTGLHQTIEEIVRMAVQESVDVIGLSIMSGAHLPICKTLLESMKDQGIEDIDHRNARMHHLVGHAPLDWVHRGRSDGHVDGFTGDPAPLPLLFTVRRPEPTSRF